MKKVVCSIFAAMAVAFTASGAIEPVVFTFSTNTTTYTAPAGKVLVIRHVANIVAVSTADRMSLVKDGVTNTIAILNFLLPSDMNNPSFSRFVSGEALQYPLIIPAGTELRYTPSQPTLTVIVFGLLVDPSDLYVAVEHEINSIGLANNPMLAMGLKTETARPVRFQVEKTTDPDAGWESATGATVQSTEDKRQYDALALADAPSSLFRTKAIPRDMVRK